MHARADQLKHRVVLRALFVALFVTGCAGAPVAAPAPPHVGAAAGPPFVARWQDAKARAAREHKPIFVDAWAPWCHTCLSMRSFVLSDPSLRPFYDRFVWLALDAPAYVTAERLNLSGGLDRGTMGGARARLEEPQVAAESQWTVLGTRVVGRPAVMNCSSAIWAVASCMATRSG